MKKFLSLLFIFSLLLIADSAHAAITNPHEGQLIKGYNGTAVYYVDADGFRHAFPNSNIYFSWYSDFSAVQEINDFDLSLYPLGKNITYRPGSRLVKIQSVSEVYAVEPGGILRNVPSEASALDLFGDSWSTYIDDIDISLFFDYEIGGTIDIIDGTPMFPTGSVVNYNGKDYLFDKRTDGIFMMREISEWGGYINGLDKAKKYVLSNNRVREFTEFGPQVLLAEARFSCLVCSPKLMSKKDVTLTKSFESANKRYKFQLPQDWSVEEDAEGLIKIMAIETNEDDILIDQFGDNLMMLNYDALEYQGDLDSFLADMVVALTSSSTGIIYSGDSTISVATKESLLVSDDGVVSWSNYLKAGDFFHQFQFTTSNVNVGYYVDVLHLIFSTIEVNELVPETL